jgi:hypothetical protein
MFMSFGAVNRTSTNTDEWRAANEVKRKTYKMDPLGQYLVGGPKLDKKYFEEFYKAPIPPPEKHED